MDDRGIIVMPVRRAASEVVMPDPAFEYSVNKTTGEKFPDCCQNHKKLVSDIHEWFDKFPNCCAGHKEIAQYDWFRRDDYLYVPEKLIKQIAYTESFIYNNVDKDDWFEQITDYLDANEFSFGIPSIGSDHYFSYFRNFVKTANYDRFTPEKRERLHAYMTPNSEKVNPVDLAALIRTYQRWLKYFPFDLEYFKGLKSQFTSQLPILVEGSARYNRFTGFTKACVHSETDFLQILFNTTVSILSQVDTEKLIAENQISNPRQYKIDLVNAKHKISQDRLLQSFEKGEIKYMAVLKKWLKAEKEYVDEIVPLLTPEPEKVIETKEEAFRKILTKYGFFKLGKVSQLSTHCQERLFSMIYGEAVPYRIAMFDYLGFLDYLKREHFDSFFALYKGMSIWFGTDKQGRTIKGNIASLNPVSKEDKKRYTAYKHKNQVEMDYKSLK